MPRPVAARDMTGPVTRSSCIDFEDFTSLWLSPLSGITPSSLNSLDKSTSKGRNMAIVWIFIHMATCLAAASLYGIRRTVFVILVNLVLIGGDFWALFGVIRFNPVMMFMLLVFLMAFLIIILGFAIVEVVSSGDAILLLVHAPLLIDIAFMIYVGYVMRLFQRFERKRNGEDESAAEIEAPRVDAVRASSLEMGEVVARVESSDGSAGGKMSGEDSPLNSVEIARLERADSDVLMCKVCLEKPKNTVFQPCHHSCTCESCTKKLMKGSKKCPVCRSTISSFIKIFHA